jgi:TPR repeat protein
MEGVIGPLGRVVLFVGMAVFACSAHALGDDEAALLKRVQAAAKAGDAKAEYQLANLYLSGGGVGRDAAKAAGWYRKAAEQGYGPAQSELGALYLRGIGVPKDEAQAIVWVRKAAEQGEVLAQSDLGMMYLNGQGVEIDNAQALVWLRKAAEQGSAAGQHNLASLYQRGGGGLAKDDAEARRWYGKAALQDRSQLGVSQSRMALCLYGGEHDVWCTEAESPGAFGPVEDLTAAAEGGDTNAQSRLGDIYGKGIGVQKDALQSFNWYRKAATAGYAPAQTQLGYIYSTGIGVPKDEDASIAWYCEAAAQGHRRALINLEIMRTYGSFDPDKCPERRALR